MTTTQEFTVANGHAVADVLGMLSDLAKMATKPGVYTPSLEHVRLHVDSGKLHGWATNRYLAAHAVTDVECETGFDPVLVHVSDIKRVVAQSKKASLLVVSHNDGRVTFNDYTSALGALAGDLNMYPKVHNLVTEELPITSLAMDPVGFDPAYMAEIAAIGKRRREYVYYVPSVLKPSHYMIGEDFRVWLMPAKGGGSMQWLAHSWQPSESDSKEKVA